MYPSTEDLKELIAKAEAGEVRAAREGLRDFTRKRPSVLLAWKWLADVAENPKERAEAIRRAQLLAPGDPWVIEAKKHRMPPKRASKRSDEAMHTRPLNRPISASAPPPAASGVREPAPDDLTLVNRMRQDEALERAIERSQPALPTPEQHAPSEPTALVTAAAEPEPAAPDGAVSVAVEAQSAEPTLPRAQAPEPAQTSPTDVTLATPATPQPQPPVTAPPPASASPSEEIEAPPDEIASSGAWMIWAVVGLAVLGIGLLVAAALTANLF